VSIQIVGEIAVFLKDCRHDVDESRDWGSAKVNVFQLEDYHGLEPTSDVLPGHVQNERRCFQCRDDQHRIGVELEDCVVPSIVSSLK
jgi:hypothetical protein